ncbi:OFA family MFS transporter [Sporomusa sp. KB1]|uniref:L-lactate MFS transporter n=1 Tax=Sporomusa sp. KB1 TaxID=943346 RepID=UPI00119F9086|nr:OFA family MFS transporter [Sporomusa sp. KB1]TWH46583.1 OFA family oxalate/formate antiporter-like MFS transporter [Sporomusa sp. KB1]
MKGTNYPNRWLIALAGIVMQICLGTVYGWSVFTKPLMAAHNWSNSEVTLTFTIAIGFLAISSAAGGYILDTKGARIVATIGGILFGLGTLITGYGDQIGSLTVIYIGYGLVCGLGLGFGYITPIATLVKWFPDKRGLITGLAVMGFGLGSLMLTMLSPGMIASMGTAMTFYIFGGIFLVAVTGAAQLMVEPPIDYVPAGWMPPIGKKASDGMTLGQAVGSKYFYLLWAMLFLNITAGIALISQASPMAQELMPSTMSVGEKAMQAGVILGLFAIVNGLGRLFWASVSDKIGRRTVFFILFSTQAIAFYFLSGTQDMMMFTIICSYIYACYGGGFSTMPAYAADIFGTKYVGRIYGWMLTAWGAAGIMGPMLFSRIRQASGNYSEALIITAVGLAIALVLPLLAAPSKAKIEDAKVA